MKKIKISFIIVLAVVGAFLIYNHFDNGNANKKDTKRFYDEYTLVDKNNVFVYKHIDDIIRKIETGTGIVFFCFPESVFCQDYAKYLNDIAIENDVKEIYYFNIKQERITNSSKYQKIVNLLDATLYRDDEGNKRIYVPYVVFVKSGNIVGYNNETSFITQDITPLEYWTEERINLFKNNIKTNIDLLKEEA